MSINIFLTYLPKIAHQKSSLRCKKWLFVGMEVYKVWVGKLQLTGQIWPSPYFHIAHELKTKCIFLAVVLASPKYAGLYHLLNSRCYIIINAIQENLFFRNCLNKVALLSTYSQLKHINIVLF